MRISSRAIHQLVDEEILYRPNRRSKRLSVDRFVALFGVSPRVASWTWNQLDRKRLLPRDCLVKHFLWGLAFLKLYTVECASASIFSCDEKTFGKWTWQVLDAVGELDLVRRRQSALVLIAKFFVL